MVSLSDGFKKEIDKLLSRNPLINSDWDKYREDCDCPECWEYFHTPIEMRVAKYGPIK